MKPSETAPPAPRYRRDYTPPDFWVDRFRLHFELGEGETVVTSTLAVRRRDGAPPDAPLRLDGEQLELLELSLDGVLLESPQFSATPDGLTLPEVPDRFELTTKVRIVPENNTELSGLYKSSGNFCTQCEAEGFRRITYHLDRPDVMSLYEVTLVADPNRYPVLLSNGNKEEEGTLDDGRRFVRWVDPFKKPSYLFALVAGRLECHAGRFTTRSGRDVRLEVWVEPQNLDKCEHALRSLERAMAWDEETFGLEYDLDIYMIVAVGDFNMGAMENKGLNVFNAKYVLARPDTATDDDYEHIEAVIGHEYFHNWTGNRVTCRDWFQLTLKEGLTVFRDQLFTADMTSEPVKRISDVRLLRATQFEEDAGPMAHPVRPDSYISMDNFYTATVYVKGAEVVRMYHTLLGADGFRRGMDLYFERHDGQAVTCDDFLLAMAHANDRSLSRFERWYEQAGTPTLRASGVHDPEASTYTLTLSQTRADRPGHAPYEPCLMPVRVGLIGPDGQDLPLRLAGAGGDAPTERVLELSESEARFVFEGIEAPPVPSVLRGFSAPVRLELDRSREELAFSFANDNDPFNRWDAGQTLAELVLLELVQDPDRPVDARFVAAYGQMLADRSLDGSSKALAMSLPAERVVAQRLDEVDPAAVHGARERVLAALAEAHEAALVELYETHRPPGAYRVEKLDIDTRRVKNAALSLLSMLGEKHASRAAEQFDHADNMTDAQSALSVLVDIGGEHAERALAAFHAKWRHDPLVLDKWFSVQAGSRHPDTLDRVVRLRTHPDFTLDNPNRARSLIGVFALNQAQFHDPSGAGYRFLGDQVVALHAKNPQIAARLVSTLNGWRRFEPGRRATMKAELERVAAVSGLSKDVFEIVQRALA